MARNIPSRGSQQLFESERRFRLLVEGVVDYAIFMLDPNGVIANGNAGAERIHGYGAGEIVGLNFSRFYTAEERDAGLPEKALATARGEGKYAAEGWRLRKDGTRFFASVVIDPIYDSGKFVGFAEITRDVTERQAAAAALHESDRQFQLLVSNVTDYALFMLDPEGRVASWNAGGERIKGYTSEEIIGRHFSQFYTEADRAANRPARVLEIARDTGRYEEEGWRVRRDGSYFWASVIIDPIRDDRGRLLGFAKITRDITERRDAQVAMERVQQQLAESQKMDALGQLTGGVAHDFNNLLMVVSGHIQILKRTVAGNARASRAAQAIEHAAERGATLTGQLLTFARRARVNPQPIDLRQRIDAIREVLVSGLGRNIRFVVDIAADIWPVTIDIGEFEIALVNLVINARDAMPEGGMVTITAKNELFGVNEPAPPGEYVVIGVEDTGVGIPDDILVRVFEPFFTTKPVGKGTGLGLSQVYGFAHQAGGSVKIDSTLGQGTMLRVYLPRATNGAISVEGGEPAKETASAGAVLLVEDNPDVASASAGLLEQLGYEVKWVSSAEAALAALAANGFNLVFSDIVMPGRLDGLGLAKIVRQRYPDMPILLATGYSGAAQIADSDFTILRKPYRLNELSQALARLTHA
jgi:PAS domain S-box-containing protein